MNKKWKILYEGREEFRRKGATYVTMRSRMEVRMKGNMWCCVGETFT